ncbi:MAG: hypothetical protein HN392_13775 [Anaerolineae bacterium]|jgi:hypothetical protein|nr:hypothetical protein [Anaerolineae bacterium]
MSDKNSPYFKGAIWLGLVFLLAGGAVMIQSIRVGMTDATTPRWTGFAFGLIFFNAGITVGLMDASFNRYRESKIFVYFQATILLSIPLIFLVLLNWVAFGPDEREFNMNISIPFLSFDSARGSEIIGRIAFGIPALLMDAFLGYVVYGVVVDTYDKKKDDELTSYLEEMDTEDK